MPRGIDSQALSGPPRSGRPWRTAAIVALKLALAGALFAYLVSSGRLRGDVVARALAAPAAIAFAVAAIGVSFSLQMLRWWMLLRGTGLDFRFRTAAKLTMIGAFFNMFMPGAVGGDAFKMYYAVEHAPGGKKVEAATTVAMDRLIGLSALGLIAAVAMIAPPLLGAGDTVFDDVTRAFGEQIGPLGRPIGIVAAVGVVLFGAACHPGVRDWAIVRRLRERVPGAAVGDRVLGVFVHAVRSPWSGLGALGFATLAHLSTVACFFVLGRALGESALGIGRYAFLVPIGLTLNAIPASPGGLGIGEAAFERLFAIALGAGVRSPGADICVVWRTVTIAWNLAGGVLYVLHRRGEPDPALLQSEP